MMNKLRSLYLKDDRFLLGVALVTLAGVFALMALGKITLVQGSTFLVAAFGFPSLIGVRSPGDDVVLVDDDAPPTRREGPPPGAGGALLVLLGFGLALAGALVACLPPPSPAPTSPEQRAASEKVADAAYHAQMLACADATHKVYATRADSDACLARTRAAWHRLPDGGADPSAVGVSDGGAR